MEWYRYPLHMPLFDENMPTYLIKRRPDMWVRSCYQWYLMHIAKEKEGYSWLPTLHKERVMEFPTRKAAEQEMDMLSRNDKKYEYRIRTDNRERVRG